ncbi:hypothetical protein ACHHYP_13110 [Achlya hypogyna]|uniref:Uncharacterized protein n=1 Tax=Achlya hypogyna TaxID=1202772 RepID=A0A1V9YFZ9_ACHHY|nr:hypothetical protein ACHHYP_13110 [Achlya hypogyna]
MSSDSLQERRRLRDRRAKQAARARFLTEYHMLQEALTTDRRIVMELRARVQKRPRDCLLSWADVASALADATDESRTLNVALRDHVSARARLVDQLHAWVIATLPQTPPRDYGDLSLPTQTDVREVLYHWIAEHMLAATLHQVVDDEFPEPSVDWIHTVWDKHRGCIYAQQVLAGNLTDVTTAGWTLSITQPMTPNSSITTIFQTKTSTTEICYHRESSPTGTANRLIACFREASRGVWLHRTIRNDAAYPITSSEFEADIMEWNVARRLSASTCVVRTVRVHQASATYASMTEYTAAEHPQIFARARLGPVHDVEAEVERLLTESALEHMRSIHARMNEPLATSVYVWRNLDLSADEELRSVGVAWIAEQMRCATAVRVASALFPSPLEDAIRAEWTVCGGRVCVQQVLRGSLHEVATAAWSFNQAMPTLLLQQRGGAEKVYHQKTATSEVRYNRERVSGIPNNALYTCHITPTQVITTYRTLRNDAAFPREAKQFKNNVQEWNVLHAVSPSTVVVRSTHICQPYATYATFEEYAADVYPWLRDKVPEGTDVESCLQSLMIDQAVGTMKMMQMRMVDMLLKVQANPAHYIAPCAWSSEASDVSDQ